MKLDYCIGTKARMYKPYFKYSRNFIRGGNNFRNGSINCGHCTEVRFASFFSGGFNTMTVINLPERKLAKRTFVHWGRPSFSRENERQGVSANNKSKAKC